MNKAPTEPLDQLIHDVNSKCSSLKGAAALLPASSPQDRRELLGLMAQEAQSLAQHIAGFQDSPSQP